MQSSGRLPMRLPLILVGLGALSLLPAGPDEDEDEEAATPFPDPVAMELEGFVLAVDPALLAEESREVKERAFEALANHLQRVRYIVPEERLAELRRIPIRIDLEHPRFKSLQYHPSREWLARNGHDPRLAKHVHIPRASELYDRRMWAKHPCVVLHELAHAYHDQVLGFDHPGIAAAYERAKEAGTYDEVLLFTGARVKHYGMTDAKEHFAEATEAYLGVNDFYPFVRAELAEHDPAMHELLVRIWGAVP